MWPFKKKWYTIDEINFASYAIGDEIVIRLLPIKKSMKLSIIDIINDDIMIVKLLTLPNPFLYTWRRKSN